MTRSSSSLPLPPFPVERRRGISMERQVYVALRQAITDGRLHSGVRLPSTRQLAETLDVSRTVVLAAFQRLVTEGYVRSYVGSGTYVAADRQRRRGNARATRRPKTSRWAHVTETLDMAGRTTGALAPGSPAVDQFPRRRWTQMIGRWWRDAPAQTRPADSPQGLPRLRAAIADYIGCMRGIACTADDVIITAGAEQAMHCIARTFADPGETIVLEDPCPPAVRALYEAADVLTIAWPVDSEGVVVDSTNELRARMIHVTPSAQDPLGVMMSGGRRYQLLQWAAKNATTIVEQDNDCGLGEANSPALKSIDAQGQVIYVGSFAKTMLPEIDVAFIIAPSIIVELLTRVRRFFGGAPSPADQSAMTDFIAEGDYARHLRRVVPVLQQRRDALHAELRRQLEWAVVDVKAGSALQSIATLRGDIDDRLVAEEARARGIHVAPLSSHYARSAEAGSGLVLGYGSIDVRHMPELVALLAEAMASVATP